MGKPFPDYADATREQIDEVMVRVGQTISPLVLQMVMAYHANGIFAEAEEKLYARAAYDLNKEMAEKED